MLQLINKIKLIRHILFFHFS